MKEENRDMELCPQPLREQVLDRKLEEWELLELALGYGVGEEEAHMLTGRLRQRFGSLRGVMRAAPEALSQVEGMTEAAVLLLQLLNSLSYNRMRKIAEGTLDNTDKRVNYLWPYFFRLRRERFYLLGLNEQSQLRCCELLGEGGDTFVDLDIKRMCAVAVRSQSTGVVLAHNHPGGVNKPSQNDIKFTRVCRKALEQLNIRLLDHLVFTDEECISLTDSRMID